MSVSGVEGVEAKALVEEADEDANGSIDWEEFQRVCTVRKRPRPGARPLPCHRRARARARRA